MFSTQRFLSILALVGMANAFNGPGMHVSHVYWRRANTSICSPATFFTPAVGGEK